MKLEITQTIEIEVPPVPLHLKAEGAKRANVSIADLPDEALQRVGHQWTSELIRQARDLRGDVPGETS